MDLPHDVSPIIRKNYLMDPALTYLTIFPESQGFGFAFGTILSVIIALAIGRQVMASIVAKFFWMVFTVAWLFGIMIYLVDIINEAVLELPAIPASVAWVWFYMRVDLMLAFMGPTIAVGVMVKFLSRKN